MSLIIKKVECKDLYPLRNKVLRNNKGIQYCKFDGDENEDTCLLYTSPSPRDRG